jgi:small subunit ribosomal protein S8
MVTDPIADFLARIRNAQTVKHAALSLPASKMKLRLAEIFKEEGYIADFSFEKDETQGKLSVTLKYDTDGKPVIEGMKRVSRPGMRVYRPANDLPRVRGGMGMAIVSTSQGVMTSHHARQKNVGGELLCYVW